MVIPHGVSDPPARVAAREHVVEHYRAQHPGWRVTLAPCPTPAWSKGAAANPHLLRSDADVVILADADSWTDPAILAGCAEQIGDGGWGCPFTVVKRLDRDATARVLSGYPPAASRLERRPARAVPGGGIVAAHRDAWQAVNGVDPRLVAGEDICLGLALRTLVGSPWTPPRPTVLWHLWHPRDPVRVDSHVWNRYRATRRLRNGRRILADIVKEW